MVFDDNINMAIKLIIYLQSQLFAKLYNKVNILLQIFLVNLIINI